ncbi:MAG: metallophosphoesterase family protein [Betaproteobacteria bacterium]
MRYLVLSDIHANLEALEACLGHAAGQGYDATIVLGDLVGYGADPNSVIDRVHALAPVAIVRGNHDKVACGLDQAEGFNAVARNAARWTLEVLTPEHRAWLAALPQGPQLVDATIEICHGSPIDEDAYIFDELDALRALKASERPLCFYGHTHYPLSFELANGTFGSVAAAVPEPDSAARSGVSRTEITLRAGSKYLINPGAVGQPRDGDPRAAYAIVDEAQRRVDLFRVLYPLEEAQAKVMKAGLPDVLAHRLALGR